MTPKIQIIRSAINGHRKITFYYYSPSGEAHRTIEPYYLVFQWSNWYVWGWCDTRNDYRLFKLNRLENLAITEQVFEKRSVVLPDFKEVEKVFPGGIHVKALFEAECKWRLVEEFGTDCFEEQDDGKLLFQTEYTDKEYLLTWLLTFRNKVILLEPEEMRKELCVELQKTLQQYR